MVSGQAIITLFCTTCSSVYAVLASSDRRLIHVQRERGWWRSDYISGLGDKGNHEAGSCNALNWM